MAYIAYDAAGNESSGDAFLDQNMKDQCEEEGGWIVDLNTEQTVYTSSARAALEGAE